MQTMAETKREMKIFEKMIDTIAGIRIIENKTKLSFDAESSRIERMVEHFYKINDEDIHFYDFGIDFIQNNANDLVNSTEYNGMYFSNNDI